MSALEVVGKNRNSPRLVDYIEFVPGASSSEVIADVSARVNWFLKDSTLPVFMEGAAGVLISPTCAPHMDEGLVSDPGWAGRRPEGRPQIVIHDFDVRGMAQFAQHRGAAIVAAPTLAWKTDQNWFELQRRFGAGAAVDAAVSADRLLSRVRPGGSVFILGTGPSAQLVDPEQVDTDVRIVCNSAVRDPDLIAKLTPDVIAFTDPVFHCGPSRYAAQFRRDLRRTLSETDAVIVTGDHWIGPVLANCPELADRMAVIRFADGGSWRWPTSNDFSVRTTANVLTLLMLPVAFALADNVEVAGCDGRQAGERYFWKHNAQTQYSDELMQSVFVAHPGFFRDRDYKDYYEQHCAELEALIEAGERAGKSVSSVTPSFIPALVARAKPEQVVT